MREDGGQGDKGRQPRSLSGNRRNRSLLLIVVFALVAFRCAGIVIVLLCILPARTTCLPYEMTRWVLPLSHDEVRRVSIVARNTSSSNGFLKAMSWRCCSCS